MRTVRPSLLCSWFIRSSVTRATLVNDCYRTFRESVVSQPSVIIIFIIFFKLSDTNILTVIFSNCLLKLITHAELYEMS